MPQFLSVDSALAFLLIHDPKDVEHFEFELPLHSVYAPKDYEDEGVKDAKNSLLTVKTTGRDPLTQDITVVAPEIDRVFKFSGKFQYPPTIPYPLQDTTNRKGTLYLRGKIPDVGKGGFNAQQYPPYNVNVQNGRVVIDFWDQSRISGVFKTDDENYVSGGEGLWNEIKPGK